MRALSSMQEKYELNIAMIISTFYPTYGGAQNQLRQLARHLSNSGMVVHIFTRKNKTYKGLSKNHSIRHDSIRIHSIPTIDFKYLDSIYPEYEALKLAHHP